MLTVITRTSNRPRFFAKCRDSIKNQTVTCNHIVISDDPKDDYVEGDEVYHIEKKKGKYPYNLYFNEVTHLIDDYVMFLDDDDQFTTTQAAKKILEVIDEDKIVLWKVKFGGSTIPDKVGETPTFANISGIGFAYHKKHWVDWQDKTGGDFSVISELYQKLEPVWINEVLTGLQRPDGRAGGAKRHDS